jgi:hypothetical protein
MQILEHILSRLEKIRRENEKTGQRVSSVPKENDESLSAYVKELWEDAEKFEEEHFQETQHLRRKAPDATVPFSAKSWRKAAQALAYGENWEHVWGHRTEAWMQERVDGEIPRKLAARKDHITANYHEFTISPNLVNVADIFDFERKRMGWKDWIEEFVQHAMIYGRAINEITIDYNIHPLGQVVNVVRSDVRRTPGAKSFSASDGCNYVVFFETVTLEQIRNDFPDLDVSRLSTDNDEPWYTRIWRKNKDYRHTKFYSKYRIYIDDPTIEEVPFDEEAQLELAQEHTELIEGIPVKARPEQHHMQHIASKLEAVENLLSTSPSEPDEALAQIPPIRAYIENILEHLDFIEQSKDKIEVRGLRQKYPNGRYICVVGNVVVQDTPNPLGVPWRRLVAELKNRRVEGRLDPAGDPEIMFREAFQADIMRSRIEELTLLNAPQVWRHISDKADARITESDDNAPRKTKYFVERPPTIVQAEPPVTLMKLFELSKGNIDRDTGVNTISLGEEQGSGVSGRQVALIQQANRVIVTGELDRNLRETLEDIIEGDLAVMKAIYKEPRQYIIDGRIEQITVSDVLSYMEVTEAPGVSKRMEVPNIEVTVKPGSNYPNQWETKLNLLMNLRNGITDPAQAQAIQEAILDHIGIEYPDFAQGGKYRQIAQATAVGLQVIAQKQAEAAAARRVSGLADAQSEIEKQILIGGSNGKE